MRRKFVLDLFVPNDVKPKMPLGVRFVLFEPSTDSWYPGGAGGNFYVPVAKEAKGDHRYVGSPSCLVRVYIGKNICVSFLYLFSSLLIFSSSSNRKLIAFCW
jgi:hypothetical protein